MSLMCFKIHYWPIITFLSFLFTFLSSYMWAIINKHIYPIIPYISDTGTQLPESSFFAQLISIASLTMGVTLYIRYRQVDCIINLNKFHRLQPWNLAGIYLGLLIVIGVNVCGNFEEFGMPSAHFLGAFITFFTALLYFFVQTRISLSTVKTQRNLLYTRILILVSLLPLPILSLVCGTASMNKFKGEQYTWWTEKDEGFYFRLVSTSCEWISTVLMLLYLVTFTGEFKSMQFEGIKFSYQNNNLIKPV